jgi:hypothetical protein
LDIKNQLLQVRQNVQETAQRNVFLLKKGSNVTARAAQQFVQRRILKAFLHTCESESADWEEVWNNVFSSRRYVELNQCVDRYKQEQGGVTKRRERGKGGRGRKSSRKPKGTLREPTS